MSNFLHCSGGVTLLFTGCDTDVVQRPELVVTSGTSTRQVRATSTVSSRELSEYCAIIVVLQTLLLTTFSVNRMH